MIRVILGLLCLLFAGAACAQSRPKRIGDLHVDIVPDAVHYAEDVPVSGEIRILTRFANSTFMVQVEGSEALSGASMKATAIEPLQVRATAAASFRFRWPSSGGEGSVVVEVTARDPAGSIFASASASFYALTMKRETWVSTASPTHLRLMMLEDSGPARFDRSTMDEKKALTTCDAKVDSRRAELSALGEEQLRLQKIFSDATSRPASKPTAESGPISRAVESRSAPVTVQGRVRWTDSKKKTHEVPMADVEVFEDSTTGSRRVATTQTNAAGVYSATFTPLAPDADVRVEVLAISPVGRVVALAQDDPVYRLRGSARLSSSPMTLNLTAGQVTDCETAFGIHHALVVIGAYAREVSSSKFTEIKARYPSVISTDFTPPFTIHLMKADCWDWDVIHHEYGHFVMHSRGFAKYPEGITKHWFNMNSAEKYGKDAGTRMVWGEGWATFFAISGQTGMKTASLGVPNVGDTRYTDIGESIDEDLEKMKGLGEDDEASVASVLWDLFDLNKDGVDVAQIGDKDLLGYFLNARPFTLGAAWNAVAERALLDKRVVYGAVFGQSKVAAELKSPLDGSAIPSEPPTFSWYPNGGGKKKPLDEFSLTFFDRKFARVWEYKAIKSLTYTPPKPDWNMIAAKGPLWWVVMGSNTDDPESPGGVLKLYWSGARTLGGDSAPFAPAQWDEPRVEFLRMQDAPESRETRPAEADLTVTVTIQGGKPSAGREVVTFETRGSQSSVTAKRFDARGALLAADRQALTRELADRIGSIVEREGLFTFQPLSDDKAYDFGSHIVHLRRGRTDSRPESREISWNQPLKNGRGLEELTMALGEALRAARVQVAVQYFPEGR